MAAEIVNLKQFKKQKARADKEQQAEQNRISFGRTKAEKSLTTARNDKERKILDAKKLEDRDE
jgi:hypothetical protein